MTPIRPLIAAALAGAALIAAPMAQAAAPAAPTDKEAADALDLAMKAIAIRSVRGPGNKAGDVAALLRDRLIAGGWAAGDVTITPHGETVTAGGVLPAGVPLVSPSVGTTRSRT